MRPNNSKLDRTHDLPKIHKEYSNVPKVTPIVDTREVRLIILFGNF